MNLASGLGGNIDKSKVLSAIDKYEKYHVSNGGNYEEMKADYADMTNKYYDLVTSFYEYGWGQSFHLASRLKGETLRESLKRHEHFLSSQLGLKPGQKVLDVGCGIGGPLREISQFSLTSITGLDNNEYQLKRAKELNHISGVDKTCNLVKADFMDMPFRDNSFDAVFSIEGTCHAPNVAEVEIGNGLPNVRLTTECLEALKEVGFEVIWEKDCAVDSPLPWYMSFDNGSRHFSLSNFRTTTVGRFITKNMVKAMEFVGLAPKGSLRVLSMLERASDGLVIAGKTGIFTPIYFILARKPGSDSN